MEVLINEQHLTDIADAIRSKSGETEIVAVTEMCQIAKSKNANGHNDFETINNGISGFMGCVPIVFEGASSIKVKMTYASKNTGNTYFYVIDGYYPDNSSYPYSSATKYIDVSTDVTEYVFEGTDSVSFAYRFYNNEGFYAECYGYDSDGNEVGVEKEVEVTRLFKPREMATAIEGIESKDPSCNGLHIPEEGLIVTGNCSTRFGYNAWNWFIEQCGDKIKTEEIKEADSMFYYSDELEEVPFEINFADGGNKCNSMFASCENLKSVPSIDFKQTATYRDCSNMFQNCYMLTSIGTLKNMYPTSLTGLFIGCKMLKNIPEFEGLNLGRIYEYTNAQATNIFQNCSSLREIPEDFLKRIYMPNSNAYYYSHLSRMFNRCCALDEIRGINPQSGAYTSNAFATGSGACFAYCSRVKDIIFAMQDDGSPYVCNWKNQTIELNYCVGYVDWAANILNYNSGITTDKEVKDDATYQALKDDPDWFTCNAEYSRYNKTSAINTINSLPDVSQGTGNTIKFQGAAGSKTDGGAINTMTEEEIAVAAAKGWTVSFV